MISDKIKSSLPDSDSDCGVVVMGAGLSGLSTGYVLSKNDMSVCLLESSSTVGGLSKTIVHGDFLFDLGGHRFLTKNKDVENFVRDLLADECLTVSRTSKIFMFNKYFDYPLRPANAIFGLGISTTLKILFDYCREKFINIFRKPRMVSLEDWIVGQFGRKMFDIYFKGYSEKVWGIPCQNISKEWIAKRIDGLSLWAAVKNAFFKVSGREIPTLTDEFIYPPTGIGRISDRLKEEIEKKDQVRTNTSVTQIKHNNFQITDVIAKNGKAVYSITGKEFVSSIPLTNLIQSMQPPPPDDILEAASKLRFRDIIIVTIMLNKESVTNLTWLYLPDDNIPFGRIHEPKNWSSQMAPEGKTHLVIEYFCFEGDAVWNSSDIELTDLTVQYLEKLDFINDNEVLDSCVLRKKKAYPLFSVGYTNHYDKIVDYLNKFSNLHIIGRGGMFKYYNMDHAMESGIEVAEEILNGHSN